MGEQWTLTFFHKGIIGSPTWMSQLEHNTKHEPAMKAVRVNGKITEVKQSSLVNNKMADL